MRRTAALVVLLVACSPDTRPAGPRDGSAATIDASVAAEVTYREHVAPILAEHCVRCHVAGGIGPFPLDSYATAQPLAGLIATTTRDRVMPPYYADNSGSCATYRDANWLIDEEIALLGAWASAGAPEGDPSIPTPTPSEPPALARVDATLEPTFDYAPMGDDGAGDLDEIRCFLVDTGIATDRIITAYQVVPGEPRVVHHVIAYEPDVADPASAAAPLEAEDARPGWRCDGGARIASHPVVLWAPGLGATTFPEGTGLRLVGGRPVVLQIHYNLSALASASDRTRVELTLASSVSDEARLLPLADPSLTLPPRMSRVETTGRLTAPAADRIWGVLPHMHQRGLDAHVEIEGGACLLDMVRWDFHWQQPYWLAAPVSVSAGAVGTITCAYDTTDDTATVAWGEGTSDEMCLAYLYVTGPG